MLAGKDPARAFQLLRRFDLLELVFNDTAGKMGEGEDYEGALSAQDNGFRYPPREWTATIQERAQHYLQYLQTSRLSLANNQISNVESTAAIFTPLILPEIPVIVPDDRASLSAPVQGEFGAVSEHEIVESSLEFLDRREKIVDALDSSEIVEMLKVHVKWPKPAGKRVGLIVEAVATYPEPQLDLDAASDASIKHRVKRFMWLTQYYSVVAPALTILTAARSFDSNEIPSDQQEAMLKVYLNMANAYATADTEGGRCRRLDGKTVQTQLGAGASSDIARALRVLQVWEQVHPSGSVEDELAFLHRLAPQLRK